MGEVDRAGEANKAVLPRCTFSWDRTPAGVPTLTMRSVRHLLGTKFSALCSSWRRMLWLVSSRARYPYLKPWNDSTLPRVKDPPSSPERRGDELIRVPIHTSVRVWEQVCMSLPLSYQRSRVSPDETPRSLASHAVLCAGYIRRRDKLPPPVDAGSVSETQVPPTTVLG